VGHATEFFTIGSIRQNPYRYPQPPRRGKTDFSLDFSLPTPTLPVNRLQEVTVIEGTFVRKPEFVRAWQLETDDTGHALADPPYCSLSSFRSFSQKTGCSSCSRTTSRQEGEIIAEAPWGFDVCTPNEFAAKYDLAERGPFQRPLVRTSGPPLLYGRQTGARVPDSYPAGGAGRDTASTCYTYRHRRRQEACGAGDPTVRQGGVRRVSSTYYLRSFYPKILAARVWLDEDVEVEMKSWFPRSSGSTST
jgi:hypothetical protein